MKNNFRQFVENTPPVTFFHGNIAEDNGEYKVAWHDPRDGFRLLDEKDLVAKEKDSRKKLDPAGDRNEWIYQRNTNYSAERGLQKLQDFKQKHNIALTTRYRMVI